MNWEDKQEWILKIIHWPLKSLDSILPAVQKIWMEITDEWLLQESY